MALLLFDGLLCVQFIGSYVNMKNMRYITFYSSILFIMGGIICIPCFAVAENICYVEKNGAKVVTNIDDTSDGHKNNPYQSITKALENNCSTIVVGDGVYDESLVLNENVLLRGSNKENVMIKGSVMMHDGSKLRRVTVDSVDGIDIAENARCEVDAIRVINAKEGIETTAGGTLKVVDSDITLNKKGIYIQKNGQIVIFNTAIHDNSEEGLDIRAYVRGDVINNNIYNNGESGIEVIVAKNELNIFNNSIKGNDAHGIAPQYYTDFPDLGNMNIENNVIGQNSKYGMNCKAPSGGKGKTTGYWAQSMTLSANTIFENAEKDFASACKFDDEKIFDATQTVEDAENELAMLQNKEKNGDVTSSEQEKIARLMIQKQRREERVVQEQENSAEIDILYNDLEKMVQEIEIKKDTVLSRSSLVTFFVGPRYDVLSSLANDRLVYEEKINAIRDKKLFMLDMTRIDEINTNIRTMEEHEESLDIFLEEQNMVSGLFSKYFKKKYSF